MLLNFDLGGHSRLTRVAASFEWTELVGLPPADVGKTQMYWLPVSFTAPSANRIHQDSSGFNRTHQDSTGEAGLHLHLSRTFQAGTRGSANRHLAWGWLLVSRSQQHFFTSSSLRRFEMPQAFTSHPFVMQGSTGQNKCWHRRLLFTQLKL